MRLLPSPTHPPTRTESTPKASCAFMYVCVCVVDVCESVDRRALALTHLRCFARGGPAIQMYKAVQMWPKIQLPKLCKLYQTRDSGRPNVCVPKHVRVSCAAAAAVAAAVSPCCCCCTAGRRSCTDAVVAGGHPPFHFCSSWSIGSSLRGADSSECLRQTGWQRITAWAQE